MFPWSKKFRKYKLKIQRFFNTGFFGSVNIAENIYLTLVMLWMMILGFFCIEIMIWMVPKDEVYKTEQVWMVNFSIWCFTGTTNSVCPKWNSFFLQHRLFSPWIVFFGYWHYHSLMTQGRHLEAHICASHLHISSWYLHCVDFTLFLSSAKFCLLLYLR